MTRLLTPEPITASNFAEFGQLLVPPSLGELRFETIDSLQNLRSSAKPRLGLTTLAPADLPMTVFEMERHEFSSQAFMPVRCSSYLVLVAHHGNNGLPDILRTKAFRVPGTIGINYRANVWHHPMTALEHPATFAVLTFVDGSNRDENFVKLSTPMTITNVN